MCIIFICQVSDNYISNVVSSADGPQKKSTDVQSHQKSSTGALPTSSHLHPVSFKCNEWNYFCP